MGRVPAVIAAILVSVTSAVVRAGDATDPPSASGPPEVVIEPHDFRGPAAPPAVRAPVHPVAPAAPAAPGATPTPAITAAVAVTPPRPTRETHGLALAAGFGIEYGVLGLQARYDIPIRPRLIVSPFVSAGINFGLLSGPIGVSTALGTRHRFVVDLGVAPLDRFRLWVHGTPVADRTIFGPMLAAGYEHMSDGGWFQRTTIEVAYEAWSAVAVPINSHLVLFSGLAVGRRIW